MDSSDTSKPNFFKHVFNFDDESKAEILNIIQYALLAIIPIVLLTKSISRFIPEAEEDKGSLEITLEILIQVILIFISLLIIHRIITFIPNFSGVAYPEFHIIYIIMSVLLIIVSLQTKVGEKVSILVDRISALWNGNAKKKKKSSNGSQQQQQSPPQMQSMPNQILMPQSTDGTAISSLPVQMPTQQVPNYNNVYQDGNANQNEGFVPAAANDMIGGGSFGSLW
jgi:hypothetical protein